jgi:hypothetical protein
MFEVGKYIGSGNTGDFFRLRGNSQLGVKITQHKIGFNARRKLNKEFQKTLVLRKLGVNVPKPIGVMKVKFPSFFDKTLDKQRPNIHYLPEWLTTLRGKTQWGFVMRFIETDLSLISSVRVKYYYIRERKKVLDLGITVVDSSPAHNTLWSQREKKLYFIDVELWKIPARLLKGEGPIVKLLQFFGVKKKAPREI